MEKPTYYLWRNDFSTEESFLSKRNRYKNAGFRVVTFFDGPPEKDINEGMKLLIKNHIND